MKIYQIEISNLCNLTCSYCPHPTQDRPKGLMGIDTFAKALQLVDRCGQRSTWLHNFGEPLLHPHLVTFIRMATQVGIQASFFTNGVLLTDQMAVQLAEAGLRHLCVSDHIRDTSDRVRAQLDRLGLPVRIQETYRPAKTQVHTWAEQVTPALAKSGFLHAAHGPCLFQRHDAAVILWDGRINVCCIDAEGAHASGSIDHYLSDPDLYRFRPIPLCDGCNLMRGEEDLS